MINALVDILKNAIGLPVQTKYGIAQLIAGVPSVHVGNGQWNPLAVDTAGAWSYFRIIGHGQVQSADIGEPCAGVGVTMTLRYVALLERSACDELPGLLVSATSAIRGSARASRTAIGASRVDFTSIRFGIDEVGKQEFSVDVHIPLQRVLVNIDISVTVEGRASCIETCEYVPQECEECEECPDVCPMTVFIRVDGVTEQTLTGIDPCEDQTYNITITYS